MLPLKDNIPSYKKPLFLYTIIVINVIVFLFELSFSKNALTQFFYAFGLLPERLIFSFSFYAVLTIFTSMFIHADLLHIIGNMWFLWIFGDNVEDIAGHSKFLFIYFMSGIGGALIQAFLNPASNIPMIGASGAISGILGAYIILFPRAKILTLLPLVIIWEIVYIPAYIFLGLWILLQFFSGLGSLGAQGGVAWFAHIGGFLTGVLLALPLRNKVKQRRERQYDVYR